MKAVQDLIVEIPSQIPAIRKGDHITKARSIFRDYILRELFVTDDKNMLVGYIDISDVLRITDTKSNVTAEGFVQEASALTPAASLEEAAAAMRESMTGSVAIVDENNTLIGAILLSEIFPYLTRKNKLRGRVEEYMSRNVITCSPDDSVQKIHSLITDTEYVAFPVERKNELIGMVSRSDLIKYGKVRKSLVNAKKTTVEAFMTTPAITVSPNETIADAAEIMVRHDISRLPVVENGRIVGILDRHDVLKSMIM